MSNCTRCELPLDKSTFLWTYRSTSRLILIDLCPDCSKAFTSFLLDHIFSEGTFREFFDRICHYAKVTNS